MLNLFNFLQHNQNSSYVSDYPQVIFTDSEKQAKYYNNESQSQNNSGIFSFLNSDLFKQLLPFLLGGKTSSNNAIMSLLQNTNPNLKDLACTLGLFNKNKQEKNKEIKTITSTTNIIDMDEYEELN